MHAAPLLRRDHVASVMQRSIAEPPLQQRWTPCARVAPSVAPRGLLPVESLHPKTRAPPESAPTHNNTTRPRNPHCATRTPPMRAPPFSERVQYNALAKRWYNLRRTFAMHIAVRYCLSAMLSCRRRSLCKHPICVWPPPAAVVRCSAIVGTPTRVLYCQQQRVPGGEVVAAVYTGSDTPRASTLVVATHGSQFLLTHKRVAPRIGQVGGADESWACRFAGCLVVCVFG